MKLGSDQLPALPLPRKGQGRRRRLAIRRRQVSAGFLTHLSKDRRVRNCPSLLGVKGKTCWVAKSLLGSYTTKVRVPNQSPLRAGNGGKTIAARRHAESLATPLKTGTIDNRSYKDVVNASFGSKHAPKRIAQEEGYAVPKQIAKRSVPVNQLKATGFLSNTFQSIAPTDDYPISLEAVQDPPFVKLGVDPRHILENVTYLNRRVDLISETRKGDKRQIRESVISELENQKTLRDELKNSALKFTNVFEIKGIADLDWSGADPMDSPFEPHQTAFCAGDVPNQPPDWFGARERPRLQKPGLSRADIRRMTSAIALARRISNRQCSLHSALRCAWTILGFGGPPIIPNLPGWTDTGEASFSRIPARYV
uniref:Uncharacterized protein n=1 Tax=Green Sichuan pepper nepovirus satellite TaxID=2851655 RepID=A0A8F3IXV7_9VIRU|nr:hypothetical protein [Green Sichuan pepper nepovirus satellite]QWY93781.1 hypothetical protein [Green Sichuan pepper nepovirus satellite]